MTILPRPRYRTVSPCRRVAASLLAALALPLLAQEPAPRRDVVGSRRRLTITRRSVPIFAAPIAAVLGRRK